MYLKALGNRPLISVNVKCLKHNLLLFKSCLRHLQSTKLYTFKDQFKELLLAKEMIENKRTAKSGDFKED